MWSMNCGDVVLPFASQTYKEVVPPLAKRRDNTKIGQNLSQLQLLFVIDFVITKYITISDYFWWSQANMAEELLPQNQV